MMFVFLIANQYRDLDILTFHQHAHCNRAYFFVLLHGNLYFLLVMFFWITLYFDLPMQVPARIEEKADGFDQEAAQSCK
jgi:hypothetical protein